MMKRVFSCTAALLCAALLLTGSALAAATPGRYHAVSCMKDGTGYKCQNDYVLLNADGTGEVGFNDDVSALTWTETDGSFYAVDADGYALEGQFSDGQLSASYAGYEYVYLLEELEQNSVPPGRYDALSCTMDGTSYKCQDEYLLLWEDGTGEVRFNDEVRLLTWTRTDGGFTAEDENGKPLTGSVDGDQLLVRYVGYDYTYQWGGDGRPEPFSGSAENIAPDKWGSGLPYVFDQAGVLSADEVQELTARAQELSQTYPCDVHIITIDNYGNYVQGTIEKCAEEIRTGYDLGQGDDRDCIALIMSMENRKYDIVIHGAYAHQIFPADNRESIANKFLDNFRDNDWFGGFKDYLSKCESYLKGNGKSFVSIPAAIFGALIPSSLGGLIFCKAQKRKMQAVAEQTRANTYVAENGCQITYRADNYTGTTVSRVYSPRSSGSSGSSSSSSGGGGHSHTSGSF